MSTTDNNHIVEEKSYSELAIERYLQISELQEVIGLTNEEYTNVSLQCHLPKQLFGSIFVGHKATDLDSIASAIGAAELFHGIAARASEINNETAHALKIWNVDIPTPYLEVTQAHPARMTCIVDHNQKVQCADHLDYDKLIGVIDHHAMQGGTVSTSSPIYVNIHPWGSACTIIATMFFQARRSMSRQTAGILLSGILSDTLNLRSPTTTEYDCLAVSLLANFAKVSDVNDLARSLFRAKSMELLRCTPHQLVRGDLKTFECHCRNPTNLTAPPQIVKMAFGVIETTDVSGLVNLREKMVHELSALKAEESKDLVFLALVDIVSLNTQLIMVGGREVDLATRVFNGQIDQSTGLMALQGLVSRKKDFIPPLEHYLSKKGWTMPELSVEESQSLNHENFGRVELECTEFGCQTVRHTNEAAAHGDEKNKNSCNDDSCGQSNSGHHQHDGEHSHNKGLTAADLTRKILSAYKLKGPHIPTRDQIDEAITFVLGGTTATLTTHQPTGASSPSYACTILGPNSSRTVLPSNNVKRTHSQLQPLDENNQSEASMSVGIQDEVLVPLVGLDTVKRQKNNNIDANSDSITTTGSPQPKSPFSGAISPKSSALLTQSLSLTSSVKNNEQNVQQVEDLVKELLNFTTTDNDVISNMEATLQLPSKDDFKAFIQNLASNDNADASAKFLLVALSHALSADPQ